MASSAESSSWPTTTLGELTERTRPICYGVLKPGGRRAGGVPLVRTCDIASNFFDDSDLYPISHELDEEFRRSRLKGGEVLLSIQGTIGRVAICPEDYAGANISRTVALIEPDSTVSNRYLYWYLRSLGERNAFVTTGSTRASLNIGQPRKLHIPVPRMAEQKRIATILDKADASRRKRQQAIGLTDDLLRSTFLEMFGDPVANDRKWERVPLEQVSPNKGDIVDGPFGSSLKPDRYVSEGIPVIRNFNIKPDAFDETEFKYVTRETFEQLQRSEVRGGDILISTKGTVGNVCRMPELGGPSLLSASGTVRMRVTSDGWAPEFLVYQMTMPSFQQYIARNLAGTIQKYLNLTGIRNLMVIKPPIESQSKFVEARHKVRAIQARQLSGVSLTEDLFNSLSQRAFRGEL